MIWQQASFTKSKAQSDSQVGKITENPDLETDGQAEKIVGKVQTLAGKIEKKLGA